MHCCHHHSGQADVSAELEIEEALGLWKARGRRSSLHLLSHLLNVKGTSKHHN